MQGCEPIRGTRCATERGRVEHAPMDEICSRSAGRVLKPASQSLVRRKSSSTRSPLLAFLGLSLENLESRAIGPDVLACALAGARGLGRPRAAIAIAIARSLTHSLAHSLTRSHPLSLSLSLSQSLSLSLCLSVLHTLLCRFDQCPRIRRQSILSARICRLARDKEFKR